MTDAPFNDRQDLALRVSTSLALVATVLALLFLLAALPRPLVLALMVLVLVAVVTSLVLAIRAARRQQQRAARYRELLAQAAHQLRTPNATLTLELDAARLDPDLGEAGGALVDRLSAQVDAQNALVTRLLAYGRLDVHDDPVEQCKAGELARDAERILQPVARAHETDLSVAAAPGTVRGRLLELRELLVILGENAIIHGGGRVTISVRPEARRTLVEVEDSGPQRAEPVEAAGSPSHHVPAGIGLQLAELIVARHGGRLTFSEGAAASGPADGPTRSVVQVVVPHRKLCARKGS